MGSRVARRRILARQRRAPASAALAATKTLHLAATDGYAALPGRPGYPDPDVYVFGFVRVPDNVTRNELDRFKGMSRPRPR